MPTLSFCRETSAPRAGAYTLAIEPGAAPEPIGYGIGTAKVSGNGSVKLKGSLASGAKFSAITAITDGDRAPLDASLDRSVSFRDRF